MTSPILYSYYTMVDNGLAQPWVGQRHVQPEIMADASGVATSGARAAPPARSPRHPRPKRPPRGGGG